MKLGVYQINGITIQKKNILNDLKTQPSDVPPWWDIPKE